MFQAGSFAGIDTLAPGMSVEVFHEGLPIDRAMVRSVEVDRGDCAEEVVLQCDSDGEERRFFYGAMASLGEGWIEIEPDPMTNEPCFNTRRTPYQLRYQLHA